MAITKQTFRERIESEILVIDGAMGTMLQSHLPAGYCMELANLEKPELLASVHEAYADAGADLISTNTFGGSPVKLAESGLSGRAREINVKAAQLVKRGAPKAWTAGCIGPTGKLVEPLGYLTFEEAYEGFKLQAEALAEGGADVFLLETFADLKEAKIAVMAARDAANLPVLVSMTYGEDFLTFTGTPPETAADVLESLGADALGVNCSTGPEPMLEILGRYALVAGVPLFAEPNAGLPRLQADKAVHPVSIDVMAEFAGRFVQIGARLVGSCCGSNPDYTRRIHRTVKSLRPVHVAVDKPLRLSSRFSTVSVGPNLPFAVIGERINPTNRPELAEAITKKRLQYIQEEAQAQVAEGARLLDVNIGVPGLDESERLAAVIRGLENTVKTPLVMDCVNPRAVEAALRETAGKLLINSVNGEESSLDSMIPLAKQYGAGLLCLAVSGGIPKTAEERLAVLKRITDKAVSAGIPKNNLICDCLTLTVSAQQNRAGETLKGLRMVKSELGLPTVLGVSNISYGLPERSLINATFLSMAIGQGLDAAIINPADGQAMDTIRAASVLTVRDKDSKEFVRSHTVKKKVKTNVDTSETANVSQHAIFQAVIAGNRDEIGSLVKQTLDSGVSASAINDQYLIPAIEEIGRRYERKEVYLPQMILAAETMQQAFRVLGPFFGDSGKQSAGTVILCTVKGDVHDIGKNIVGLFLQNQGFKVVDLGKDVTVEVIAEKAASLKADVVGLSSLMTTTMLEMPKVIQTIRDKGIPSKVMVGGAVVTAQFAKEIGADGYAKDGVSAVDVVGSLISREKSL